MAGGNPDTPRSNLMFVLKSCPRCRGDLNGGLDGEFSCIQCGYELKPDERNRLAARIRIMRPGFQLAKAS
jgi:hypothetical protein